MINAGPDVQEIAIVDMLIANNPVKLQEIWDRLLADITFGNVNMVNTMIFARLLEKHKTRMKQLYTV